jgi:hypothetical protein
MIHLQWARTRHFRALFTWPLVGALIVITALSSPRTGAATLSGGAATVSAPNRLGGVSVYNDERDIDTYPAVAYDASRQRYLVVWMTTRAAASSSAGFDVYGTFLDRNGQPIGSEFRISDSSTAARNGSPAVVAGRDGFVVVWTTRGDACRIYGQRVTDASARPDCTLVSSASHSHSPSLVYNPDRERYALAYIEGDDYLPPTLFGAQTADCGDNPLSISRVKAVEFHLSSGMPVVDGYAGVSDAGGAFRPRLAYTTGLRQYLAVWEDRRNAGGQAYRFDIYAQRLSGNLTANGSNLALAVGGDYTNGDNSATWTPRPAVAGGSDAFLNTWFAREARGNATTWSVRGRIVPLSGSPSATFAAAEMTFAEQHAGSAPIGFLSAAYSHPAREYFIGMTSHLESVWGYVSSARIQRVSTGGQILGLDGSIRGQPGVGHAVDYANDDQFSVALAVNPISSPSTTDYMMVYGKHAPGRPAQDFDIWGVKVRMPALYLRHVYLPIVSQRE